MVVFWWDLNIFVLGMLGVNIKSAMKSLPITKKEASKVTHDINNVWHKRFQDKEYCVIETHSHKPDSPS